MRKYCDIRAKQPHKIVLTDEREGLTEAHISEARDWLLQLEEGKGSEGVSNPRS